VKGGIASMWHFTLSFLSQVVM